MDASAFAVFWPACTGVWDMSADCSFAAHFACTLHHNVNNCNTLQCVWPSSTCMHGRYALSFGYISLQLQHHILHAPRIILCVIHQHFDAIPCTMSGSEAQGCIGMRCVFGQHALGFWIWFAASSLLGACKSADVCHPP